MSVKAREQAVEAAEEVATVLVSLKLMKYHPRGVDGMRNGIRWGGVAGRGCSK